MIRIVLACILAAVLAVSAHAHSQSYGYLTITTDGPSLSGRLDLAVRDADSLLALDGDGDGAITWGEVHARETEIAARILSEISLARQNAACELKSSPLLIDEHGGESYLVLPFDGSCAGSSPLSVHYGLLFDRDAQHRGIVSINDQGVAGTFVMSPENTTAGLSGEGALARFSTFVAHGVHHIWIGYDHILFLVTLLLATVLVTRGQGIRRGLAEATKVVTAFTASHSVTLALAATGVISVPSYFTESFIALSIALAAANNIWPILTSRVWVVALVFGLVHGLGFANVLAELGLEKQGLVVALLAFNLGVELGQLAIVIVALPLIHLLVAPQIGLKTLPAANAAIVVLGLAWFSDRALGTALLPF